MPINPRGFWVVFVLSWRPLDGCNYHREGPQTFPTLALRAHRARALLQERPPTLRYIDRQCTCTSCTMPLPHGPDFIRTSISFDGRAL